MKKLIYLFLAVSLVFTACKKEEGCTDSIATNYNPDAEIDDGSCEYLPFINSVFCDISIGNPG